MVPIMIRLRPAFTIVLLALLQACGSDDTFPNRPITWICPWAAGGGTDSISRQLAFLLEQDLGVPVNVVNATGGGGVTGHTRGAVARPDGYTITMVTVELNMLHWRGLTNVTHEDYKPVMMVNQDPAGLFVRTDSEWKSLSDLEQSVRENPRKLKASGTAFGGIWHVALAGWLSKVGLDPSDITWIAMGGAAPSLQELMAAGLEIVVCSPAEAQVLLKAGKVRCLGVTSEERLPAFPDLPTLKEMGIDWAVSAFRGIAVPAGISEKRMRFLEAAVGRAVNNPKYHEFLANIGAGHAAVPSAQFRPYLIQADEDFGQIMRSEAFAGVERKYDAMFFPKIIVAMLTVFLTTFVLAGGWKLSEETTAVGSKALTDILLIVAAILFYLFAAESLGFVVSSVVILSGLFLRMKVSWRVFVPITLILVPIIYQVFAVYLRVPLPRGWIGW